MKLEFNVVLSVSQSQGADTRRKSASDSTETSTDEKNDEDMEDGSMETMREDAAPAVPAALLAHLSEKHRGAAPSLDVARLAKAVADFATREEGGDVETLRRALYCQVRRAETRVRGAETMHRLLQKDYLVPSVKYALLNGWLGVAHKKYSKRLVAFA